MAVALKNSPETGLANLLDRLPVAVLLGVVYVLGSLAVVFKGLPTLWWDVLRLDSGSYVAMTLLIVVMAAVAFALFLVGVRLMGPQPLRGLRPGVFVGLV